jgi:hypothetical protein
MENLNQLNSISDTLNSQITSLSNHKESEIIKEDFTLKNYDLKFLDCNYYKGNTDPIEIYDFTSWFEKLNKYTSSVSGNYQTGPIYYDEYWGITNSKKALSIITTIFWNLLYLLSFLLLFQGSLLGMFAIFIKDCSTLSNYVVSSENLDRGEPRFFKNEISIDYFNTCINGNGNTINENNIPKNKTVIVKN